jgi:bifunctional UDP-N-acetylglucosamine pyrophosphorylase/glucosamine-1-phosphate N-acetyltransferase
MRKSKNKNQPAGFDRTKASRPVQIVVLAAGMGKRMNSALPKVLLPLRNRILIHYLLEAIKKSGVCQRPVIVVGQKADKVKAALGSAYDYIFQAEQLGTGHAVAQTRDFLAGKADYILILYGDMPLVTAETIKKLAAVQQTEKPVITMTTVKVPDFNDWRAVFYDYGRIIRDSSGRLIKNVEKRDATPEQLALTEVNPSFYCFDANWLWQNIDQLKADNAQKEYYLTDLVGLAYQQGKKISTLEINPPEALGANTLEQLQLLAKLIK